MNRHKEKTVQPPNIAQHIASARLERGLTQTELAARARLNRQHINYFETGARVPNVEQLLKIARALDLPLQRLLYGIDRPGRGLRHLAIELRNLGLIDLWVADAAVPGAFRRPEEVVVRAVAGPQPEARIIEGIPAVLAWNRWNDFLLWAFARAAGRRTVYRLAWLAEIVLAVDDMGGFPGACPGKEDLEAFLKRVKARRSRLSPRLERWDDLGRPGDKPPRSPIWNRWRINYSAELASFRERAEALSSLATAEKRKLPPWET